MPHTPGPWDFDPIYGDVYFKDGSGVYPRIASVQCEGTTSAQYEADGRLIAAAPDLLEALLDILPFAQHELAHIIPPGDKQEVQRRVVNALEAIAKAKA